MKLNLSPQRPAQAYDTLPSRRRRRCSKRTASARFKCQSSGLQRAGRWAHACSPRRQLRGPSPHARKRSRMWIELEERTRPSGNGGARNCDGWWQLVFGFGTRGDSPQMPSYPHLVRDPHGQGLGGEAYGRLGREREARMWEEKGTWRLCSSHSVSAMLPIPPIDCYFTWELDLSPGRLSSGLALSDFNVSEPQGPHP